MDPMGYVDGPARNCFDNLGGQPNRGGLFVGTCAMFFFAMQKETCPPNPKLGVFTKYLFILR